MIAYEGHCPVCERQHRLRDARVLVQHGYVRPGTGEIYGSCYGVGWPAFELSPSGAEFFLKTYVERALVTLPKEIEQVAHATTLFDFREVDPSSSRVRLPVAIDSSDPKFEALRERKLRELQRLLEDAQDNQRRVTARIASWTPKPVLEVRIDAPRVTKNSPLLNRPGTYNIPVWAASKLYAARRSKPTEVTHVRLTIPADGPPTVATFVRDPRDVGVEDWRLLVGAGHAIGTLVSWAGSWEPDGAWMKREMAVEMTPAATVAFEAARAAHAAADRKELDKDREILAKILAKVPRWLAKRQPDWQDVRRYIAEVPLSTTMAHWYHDGSYWHSGRKLLVVVPNMDLQIDGEELQRDDMRFRFMRFHRGPGMYTIGWWLDGANVRPAFVRVSELTPFE